MSMRSGASIRASAAAGALLLVAACSSIPPPDDAIARAKLALRSAEATEAPRAAPVELQMARDKLAGAEKAAAAEEFSQARRLAQEATADAQYAQARAERVVADRNRGQVDRAIGAIGSDQPVPPGTVRTSVPAPVPAAIGGSMPRSGGVR